MRGILICLLALAACRGVLDIPPGGKHGCPEPCMVTVSGRAIPAESLDPLNHGLPNATVKLTSLDPMQPPQALTDDSGEYSFSGLTPDTPIEFNVSVPQTNPDVANLLHTVYVAGATDTNDVTLDIPIVRYRWLAQVAFQCGLFKSLDEALFAAPGTTALNNYFLTRATILGEVLEADRSPAKLNSQDISVVIDEFANSNQNPADTVLPPPATLCFLEPDPTTGEYKGVKETQTSSGRFVLFRARNMLGTGTGTGEVRIPGFPVATLDVSSGSIGFAFIRRGSSTSLPERPLTFERDVYHFFKDKTCNAVCHRPGGVALDIAPPREGPNGVMYPADWSGSVEELYGNLTKPFDTDCALADDDHDTAARVCRAKATNSLLYQKPGGLVPHQGLNLTTDDDMVTTVLRWIQDGAILR